MPEERYSVLVVDDDDAVLTTMTAILADHFEVRSTGSARRALVALRERRFDVVVADWQMPEMDGVSFLEEVQGARDTVACLLVTGHVAELAHSIPWDDRRTLALLRKPFDPALLLSRIQHLARLSAMKSSSLRLRDATTRLVRTSSSD